MKGVIMVKEIKAPKFCNVIRYLDEACNCCLLTEENFRSGRTEVIFSFNYFRYKNVSIEYYDDMTYIRCNGDKYFVRRGERKYRNIAYLMAIAMTFERSLSEHES